MALRKGILPLSPRVTPMNPESTHGDSDVRKQVMSIAVVDANLERRKAVTSELRGLRTKTFLPKVSPLPWFGSPHALENQSFDVVLVAMDGDKEAALQIIESLYRGGLATAMAYSESTDEDVLIRCMRSGVKEYLCYPFGPGVIEEAFDRLVSHSNLVPRAKVMPDTEKVTGKSFVFFGAKGGSGVTTAACNFAISLARESSRDTLLIDLDLPLGDAALNLGITSDFSTLDALDGMERLDSTFLRSLSVRHHSGLFVLAAPDKFRRVAPADDAVDKLLETAAESFEYVVIDAGSRWDLTNTGLFDKASTIYLVTQAGVPELRNSNRLIMGALQPYEKKLEVVLNRYTTAMFGIGNEAIEKALTRPAHWRIPNDYHAVRDMQNTAVPLALKESNIQDAIAKMARTASGLPPKAKSEKGKKFIFFGVQRSLEAM